MREHQWGGLTWVLATTGTALTLAGACDGDGFEADDDTGGNGGSAGEAGGDQGGSGARGGSGAAPSGGSAGRGGEGGDPDTGGTSGMGGAPSGGSGGEPEGGTGGMAGGGGEGGSPCEAPNATCGSDCVDLDTDEDNCGACDYECVHERDCVAGRCTPAWQRLSTVNATPRTTHAAGFVGGKYVVLGGSLARQGLAVASAAAYDVATDEWSALASLGSARCGHEAVSTGADILTFGGLTDCNNGTSIGPRLERFTPDNGAGAWSAVAVTGEPSARYAFAAAWTGTEMLIYGGGNNTLPTLATGGTFSPTGPAWSDASCTLANCDRGQGTAFVDGNVVRFFGGVYNPVYPTPPSAVSDATSGLVYSLVGRGWSTWPYPSGTAERVAERYADDGRRIYFLKASNVVTIYDRHTSSWLENDTATMPTGFCVEAAAAWTGSELIAWSGSCGGEPVNVGGRYQPAAP